MALQNFRTKIFILFVILFTYYACSKDNRFDKQIPFILDNSDIKNIELLYYNGQVGGFNEGYYSEVDRLSKADILNFIQNSKDNSVPISIC